MATLQPFNGLQVLAPPGSPEPPGPGGAAINDNFVNLAQRIGACNYTATRDPATTDNASNTPPYTAGSRWFNTTTNSEWVCIASSTSSATWEKTTTIYSVGTAIQATLTGNARGADAIDLQLKTNLVTQVASGNYSILGGAYNTASGHYSVACGFENTSSNYGTIAVGQSNSSSGYTSVAVGAICSASNYYSLAFGLWSTASARYSIALNARATKQGQLALGWAGGIGTPSQRTECMLHVSTTDATQTELTLNGGTPSGTTEPTSNRFIIASSKSYICQIAIAARTSTGTTAMFLRSLAIKNVSGAVSLEGTVQTIGTDINPSGWPGVTLQADGTNGSLQILVTGAASTSIRWSAVVRANEITY